MTRSDRRRSRCISGLGRVRADRLVLRFPKAVRYLAVLVITGVLVSFYGIDGTTRMAEAQFNAVVITRSLSAEAGINRRHAPGREIFQNTSAEQLISEAYGIDHPRFVNLPDWASTARYDIVATYPVDAKRTGTMRPPVPRMLQVLLAERFALDAKVGPTMVWIKHIQRPSED